MGEGPEQEVRVWGEDGAGGEGVRRGSGQEVRV